MPVAGKWKWKLPIFKGASGAQMPPLQYLGEPRNLLTFSYASGTVWKVCKWCLQELLRELTNSKSSAFGLVSPANEDDVCMWEPGKLKSLSKVGKYAGSASNEWEVDCHWKVKRINCFHTWMPNFGPKGMRYVGNIHIVQDCILMKYHSDQAIG